MAGPPPLALPRLPAARRAALPAGRRRFRLLPSLWLGTGLLAAVLGLALLAGPLTRLDPTRTGAPPLHPPSAAHPLGTDDLGRDLWSNVAFGARASLAVGVGATALATVAGVAVGAAAGLYGGWWDEGLMRGAEFVQVIPRLLVALLLVALFGGDLLILVAVIALTGWPMTARLVPQEHLMNAISLNSVSHSLPNVAGPAVGAANAGGGAESVDVVAADAESPGNGPEQRGHRLKIRDGLLRPHPHDHVGGGRGHADGHHHGRRHGVDVERAAGTEHGQAIAQAGAPHEGALWRARVAAVEKIGRDACCRHEFFDLFQ